MQGKTLKQIADQLGVSKQQVYRFVKRNGISEAYQDNGTMYYSETAEALIIKGILDSGIQPISRQRNSDATSEPHCDAHQEVHQDTREAHRDAHTETLISMLQKELESKNRQIEQLNEALQKSQQLLDQEQQLHLQTQQQLNLLQAPSEAAVSADEETPDAEQKKSGWFKRLFAAKKK